MVVYAINGMITPLIYAASLLGKKFISAESYDKLKQLEFRLNGLNQSLVASGFSLSAFGDRAIASSEQVKKLVEAVKMEDIIALANELENAGKTQLQIIDETHRKRLALITAGLQQELITQTRFAQLKRLVELDFAMKRKEEMTKELQKFHDVLNQIEESNVLSQMDKLRRQNSERVAEIQKANNLGAISYEEAQRRIEQSIQLMINKQNELDINAQTKWSDIGNAISQEFDKIGFSAQTVAKEIKNAFVNGLTSSFQWLGRSLANHSADWKDLQKNVGNILAGLASMLGNVFIAIGVAQNATPILGLSGSGAIAAGLALHVLAGALGTMGGGAEGTPTAGASAGNQSLGPDLNQIPTKPDQGQRQEPQNVLNVTINGDVLDSDESSMRIVKLINEAYDKKGVVLRQGAFA
jgi:hypothetical protein